MGEGPIPFSAVDRFARRYGIDDIDAFDRLLTIIMEMDGEFRSTRSEQSRRAAELKTQLAKEEAAEASAKPPIPKLLTRGGGKT